MPNIWEDDLTMASSSLLLRKIPFIIISIPYDFPALPSSLPARRLLYAPTAIGSTQKEHAIDGRWAETGYEGEPLNNNI